MIAQSIDLCNDHEIVIANDAPNPIPDDTVLDVLLDINSPPSNEMHLLCRN